MNPIPKFIECTRCAGDGYEMCRVDQCDFDINNKCIDCKGMGKFVIFDLTSKK